MSEQRYFSIILKPVQDGWIQLLHAEGYIFLEHNGANIRKTDFKNVQISSWDDLPDSPFWWSFAPKTIPIGKFHFFSEWSIWFRNWLYIGDFVRNSYFIDNQMILTDHPKRRTTKSLQWLLTETEGFFKTKLDRPRKHSLSVSGKKSPKKFLWRHGHEKLISLNP